MKLCKRQFQVTWRHQPCFDFLREIKMEVEKGEATKENIKPGDLLSNLTVDIELEDSDEKEKTKSVRKQAGAELCQAHAKFE